MNQILYLPDTNLGVGVPKKVASVVFVNIFLAPMSLAAKKVALVELVYIPPLLMQGVAPVPSTQWAVSDTKLCQGLEVRLVVHINMKDPVSQLSKRNDALLPRESQGNMNYWPI